jgi:hypothetical protein
MYQRDLMVWARREQSLAGFRFPGAARESVENRPFTTLPAALTKPQYRRDQRVK